MPNQGLKETSEEIVDYSLSRGADDVVVNAFSEFSRQLRFSESRIDIFNGWRDQHFQLFMAKGGKVVSTQVKDAKSYRKIVDSAIRTADISPESKDYMGIASSSNARSRSRKIENISDRELVNFVKDAMERAKKSGAVSAAGSLYHNTYSRYLCTSTGVSKHEDDSHLYFSIRCFADDTASGHGVTSSVSVSAFKPEDAAEKAAGLAKLAMGNPTVLEGEFDTVLDPMVTAVVASQVGEMNSAYAVISGFSCFRGKVGKHVASDAVTIEDDATRPLMGRRAFDDEGLRTRKTVMIQRGTLKTHLHNTSTAKKFKTKSTANAGLVSPRPFCISMKEGRSSHEDLIEGVDNGLFINNVWYTRYQSYAQGNFSTLPRDAVLTIKKGELSAPVRNIRVTENLLRLLKNIVAVSKEREHVSWWYESIVPSTVPYALVRNLNITRSSDLG
ncbi:MAG: TldD/PmbA family protein [Methanomassiliicoccales archaeon]